MDRVVSIFNMRLWVCNLTLGGVAHSTMTTSKRILIRTLWTNPHLSSSLSFYWEFGRWRNFWSRLLLSLLMTCSKTMPWETGTRKYFWSRSLMTCIKSFGSAMVRFTSPCAPLSFPQLQQTIASPWFSTEQFQYVNMRLCNHPPTATNLRDSATGVLL